MMLQQPMRRRLSRTTPTSLLPRLGRDAEARPGFPVGVDGDTLDGRDAGRGHGDAAADRALGHGGEDRVGPLLLQQRPRDGGRRKGLGDAHAGQDVGAELTARLEDPGGACDHKQKHNVAPSRLPLANTAATYTRPGRRRGRTRPCAGVGPNRCSVQTFPPSPPGPGATPTRCRSAARCRFYRPGFGSSRLWTRPREPGVNFEPCRSDSELVPL